jgi:hypothetical protein
MQPRRKTGDEANTSSAAQIAAEHGVVTAMQGSSQQ